MDSDLFPAWTLTTWMTFGFAKLSSCIHNSNCIPRSTKIPWAMQLFGEEKGFCFVVIDSVLCEDTSVSLCAFMLPQTLLALLTHSASARKYPKRAEPVAFWENEDSRLSPYCLIPQIHWSRKQHNIWSNVLILDNYTGNRRIILHEVAADRAAFIRPSLVLSVGYIRAEYGSHAESQHVPIQTL